MAKLAPLRQRDPRVSGAMPVTAVPAPGFALHSPVSGHATAVQMRLVPNRAIGGIGPKSHNYVIFAIKG